jgi:hypothetical protein
MYVCFGKNIFTVGASNEVMGSPSGSVGGPGATGDFTL